MFAFKMDRAMSAQLCITHVVRQFLPNRGGLEDVVLNLCREQVKEGFGVRVVTLDRLFSNPEEVLAPRETIEGINVIRIPYKGSTRYPLAPRIFAHIAEADLIHVHAIDFFFDALAMSRLFHHKPLIATTHGGFFHTKDFSRLKTLWFNGPTRFSALGYDAIVACSSSDGEKFGQLGHKKVAVIENGVDLSKYAGMSSPVPAKRIVSLGRFSKNKRPERLIAMAANLASSDPEWHLDLIGSESDWSAEALRNTIDSYGIASNVTLHLGLDNRAVSDVMRRASLFVSASEFEGFGLALIEAMSAGLVPVVQPNAAFQSLAHKHASIRTADFADTAIGANAIRSAYTDLETNATISRPTLAELTDYTWPKVAGKYMEVYRGIWRQTPYRLGAGVVKHTAPLH